MNKRITDNAMALNQTTNLMAISAHFFSCKPKSIKIP